MDNMFSLLQLIIGVYLLYCAAMGKGKIFENDYIKVPRAEYVKKLRVLSAISGAILTATSALEYFGVLVPGTTLGWISWAVGLASIIPMMVYSSKSTDREAAKAGRPTAEAAKAKGQPMPAKDPLRAAFVFDDEEDEPDNLTGNGKE